MSYAVYNAVTNSVKTFVDEPKGALPEGYVFILDTELPNGWVREDIINIIVPPSQVSLWAFKAVAKIHGYLQQINDLIAQLPEPNKTIAESQWEYATVIERNHPTTIAIGQMLGLTSEQIDALFLEAESIQG